MKGRIVLSEEEARRAAVLGEVSRGTVTLREAAVLLGISYRQARRVIRRFRDVGVEGLVHRGRGRPAANAIDADVRSRVLELHEQEYWDFNDTHFTEMLEQEESISVSRETVRKILRGAGKPPKRKRRLRKHRSRRAPEPKRGIMVQWDGSPHPWFGSEHLPCCLLSAIDDADSTILAALFVPQESAIGYLRLLDRLTRTHGTPLSIYQDCHSIHKRTDSHWSLEEEILGVQFSTHVGRVLEDLHIRPIFAYSPQAKGRVERAFGTMQDRLVPELRRAGITDLDDANRWLEEVFIPRHNRRFAKKPLQRGSAFQRISKREIRLKIAFAYETTVSNDNCASVEGLVIHIPPGRGRRASQLRQGQGPRQAAPRWRMDCLVSRHQDRHTRGQGAPCTPPFLETQGQGRPERHQTDAPGLHQLQTRTSTLEDTSAWQLGGHLDFAQTHRGSTPPTRARFRCSHLWRPTVAGTAWSRQIGPARSPHP